MKFTSTDVSAYCVPGGEDRLSALLVPVGSPCIRELPSYATCDGAPGAGSELSVTTSHLGASVQVFTGAVPNTDYPITATCDKATVTKSVTFSLHTDPFGNCTGSSTPSNELQLVSLHPADQYGNDISAGAVGDDVTLRAKMHFIKEGWTTGGPVTFRCGDTDVTCAAVVGNKQYETTTDLKEPSYVSFNNKKIETPDSNGIYTYKHPLEVGPNKIEIKGTGTIGIKQLVPCNNCAIGDADYTDTASATMSVYGVAITVPQKLLILVDESGFAVGDTPIQYTIEPSDYTAATAYVAIIRDGSPMWYIPGKTKGTDTVTLAKGYWFDMASTYTAQVVLNAGTGVEIKSAEIQLKVACFKIVKPEMGKEILIKNNESGEPQMPPLTAEVTLQGKDITPDMLTNLEISWKVKVEYIVNITKPKAEYRSRKGLDPSGAGKGQDGYLIPDPVEDNKEWNVNKGPTYAIPWDIHAEGGLLQITAKTTIEGVEVSDTYEGSIQGQLLTEDANFETQVINYLEHPTGVSDYQKILDAVNCQRFFRAIHCCEYDPSAGAYSHFERLSDGNWKNLGPVLGYSSDFVFPVVNKDDKSTPSAPRSDGGFGLMQLTEWGYKKVAEYKEIWNWKENIHAAINKVIKPNLETARAYPNIVKNYGCTKPKKWDEKNKRWIYPCRPMDTIKKDENAKPFDSYELRMDVYSLYNSYWHYWIWDRQNRVWLPWKSAIDSQQRGFRYANKAKSKESQPCQ